MAKKRPNRDANESPQTQGGGVPTLRRPKGTPNPAKSNPGVSGRPLGPPTARPAPPPARRGATASRPGPPNPPRSTGSGSVEPPINTAARIRAAGGGAATGTVPSQKVGESAEEAVAGVPGRTKSDDVKLSEKTPQPPAPKEGEAPLDPETGLPQKAGFDGSFTDEEGNALNSDGSQQINPETGLPMNPEQALSAQLKKESGATSNFESDRQARKEKEVARRSVPSEIQGVNQGHFEDVTDEKRFENYGGKPTDPLLTARLQENVKQQLAEFGSFPGQDDPSSPKPPIREGGRSFNPFTGKFTGEGGKKNFSHVKGFNFEASKRDFYKNGGSADLPNASIGSGGVNVDSLNSEGGDNA